MNCVLSAGRQSRIIIPTIYREDHLLPLKALSHNRDASPLVASMLRIPRWSAAFDYGSHWSDLRASLARCNTFQFPRLDQVWPFQDFWILYVLFAQAKQRNRPC
ncbi:hypothetical protein [Frateuria sp. Soil773]|uniref:hypothetical protein n=1 Tax=Frateuria sp. Soil773 TaxID=1736407 RepID=UPI0012F72C0C|nr:hypothetical protein [Frateuria sp. Soil773]